MRATRGIGIALALASVSCGSGGASGPSAQIKMVPLVSKVTLLDAGSEPRVPLRLHLAPGSASDISLTMNLGGQITLGGNSTPSLSLPAITLRMHAVVAKVGSAASTVDLSFTGASLSPSSGSQLSSAFNDDAKQIIGLRGRLIIDDRGQIMSLGVQQPTAPSQQSQSPIVSLPAADGLLQRAVPE